MSRRRENRGTRYSESEDLEYRYYKELRDGKVRINGAGKYLRCPYCQDRRRTEYSFSELERHASRITRESRSASSRDKARHQGLLRYLDRYGQRKEGPSRSTEKIPKELVSGKFEIAASGGDIAARADNLVLEPGEIVTESLDLGVTAKGASLKSGGKKLVDDLQSQSQATVGRSTHKGDDEPIVWPWMAIIANIPVEKKNGKYVGDGGRKLKEEWVRQGYNPIKVHPLWDIHGHSGFAIVEFNKDWEGFKNALDFEKAFEKDHHGKRAWYGGRYKDDKLYGWLARKQEYMGSGLIGKHLHRNGDLTTLTDIQNSAIRKDSTLVGNLTNELELKKKKCEEISKNISRTEIFLKNVMAQTEEMNQSYNEGTILTPSVTEMIITVTTCNLLYEEHYKTTNPCFSLKR